jgi:hypothetical protein
VELFSELKNVLTLHIPTFIFTSNRNDGDEPDYMAADPGAYLSSTMSACCKKWFGGFLYDSCMGRYPPDHDDCNEMLFYPDWGGANQGCVDDGKEPYYMLSNHHYFLSNTREECCEKFYKWDYYSCTGTRPQLTHGEYYPDWDGASGTCLNDNKMPEYFLYNQANFLSQSLKRCCERFYYWEVNKCMGITAVGTNKWYVNYNAKTCVQDCKEGTSPTCGGVADSWVSAQGGMFKDKKTCCKEKLPWENKCLTNSV